MDFKIEVGFVMALETGFTLVLVNVNGLGGGGGGGRGLRKPMNSNRSFPVMSTFKIVFSCIRYFSAHAGFQIQQACSGLE